MVFWGWLRVCWVFVMSVRCWLGFLGFVVLGVVVGVGMGWVGLRSLSVC